MLDLKGRRGSTGPAVAELLHRVARRQAVLVCGRHWPSVEHVAELPFVRAVLSARSRAELRRLVGRLETGSPVHGVSVHRSLLDPDVVGRLHRHVELVMTWPVNDLATLDSTLALGADGMISDEDEVLCTVLARRHPRT